MNENEYQKLAMLTLSKDFSKKDMLINGAMGICGESGEACDIIKKHIFHGKELDKEHLIKELGDVTWYIAELATALDINFEEIFEKNISKLKNRYPEGFDKYRANNRNSDDV